MIAAAIADSRHLLRRTTYTDAAGTRHILGRP